ncbi:hypothetical protein pb186bvf_000584 [Paramecium bursaria]
MIMRTLNKFAKTAQFSSIAGLAKRQQEWDAIAKKRLNDQLQYLDSQLSQVQKDRVDTLVDALIDLDVYEMQCLAQMINAHQIKSQGIGIFEVNTSWPILKKQELNTWPPESVDDINQAIKQIYQDNEPDFKNLFGGIGGGMGQTQQSQEAAPTEVKQEEKKQEKTSFDVELTSIDPAKKIVIIKEVRAIFNLGLKDAKDLVEKAPAVLLKAATKEKAEELKEKLQAFGCVINLL